MNRRPRNEFTKATKVAAWDRCGGHCEDCGAKLYPGKFTYDHDEPDYYSHDNSLENCKVRCSSCDKAKTKQDQKAIAKVRRMEEKHIGVRKKSGFRGWRKMNGDIVWADQK